MRVVVVGAGAWGLPAAAELARRGHTVRLLDRYGVGNLLSSSPGPTRIWRLTHPDAVRVRLALRSVEAWDRLASLTGARVHLERGLLWRDDESLPTAVEALTAAGVPHTVVDAPDVGRFFPGLRPDGRAAVWQASAGPLLAAESLRAHHQLFASAGGTLTTATVRAVVPDGERVRVECETAAYDADVVVLAPGPGAGPLVRTLGIALPLRPHLEQVVHFGDAADPTLTDMLPCLYDGPSDARAGLYAMATPGRGYKLGLDAPLRDFTEADLDRTPDDRLTAQLAARVRADLPAVPPTVLDAQVCVWTDSPDGRFVIDRVADGRVVLACGDSGEGFKFSALMGLVLADLAEGGAADPDLATFALDRFDAGLPEPGVHRLGR